MSAHPAGLLLAQRLYDIGEERLGDQLARCVAVPGWRCKQAATCPSCGRRAAIAERRSLEADIARWSGPRFLVTRTVAPTASVSADREVLLQCRRAQQRTRAWKTVVVYSRGRVDVAFGASGPMVHAHELAIAPAALDARGLAASWADLLGRHGHAGSMDVRAIEVAPRQEAFRPRRPVRHASRALFAAGADRRRAPGVAGRRTENPNGTAVRNAAEVRP